MVQINLDVMLPLIRKSTDVSQLTTIKNNASSLDRQGIEGADLVVQAAVNRMNELKAENFTANSYNKLHKIGNYVVQYTDPRGRNWAVNVIKDGKFTTEAPVTWEIDTNDSQCEIYFPYPDAATEYIGHEFPVATRSAVQYPDGSFVMGDFKQLLKVRIPQTSKLEKGINEKNGSDYWYIEAELVEVLDTN